ncbi:glutamate-rich protein 3 isoform X2 [Xenopus tropicalis]|uniref:Glutamate-rich 3 n=1 Tax=Xenopus tropicalis TaxID=8364 RepID=A0A803JUH1_XENTR|nr:glutamate-rich protein 3 isoform X2 [Xenopus tropicalis]
MSHPYVGPLSAYNSLTDKHLTGYFNNTRIRRHLQRAGLVTRSGRILTEKEFKINSMRRDHQKYIRQCLAQAIFQKVLDMERNHQIEIKRKLETFARRERIQRIKADHSKTVEEETFALFSPRPPTGPKSGVTRQMITQKELSDSSDSVSSPRPNTAPGNMQRPVRLQPIQGYCPSRTAPKTSSGLRQKESADEQEQQFPRGVDRDLMKLMNAMDHSTGVSPYRLPIINNFVIPAPPPQRKYPKQLKQTVSTSSRGRRFRPTTAPNGLELTSKDSGKFHKTILHSNVAVTMVYLGKNVHLSHDDNDFRDEIKVFQQHCGGENLCVFKGRLQEGETFNLISRRHRGFPFSLTFYINGMQVDRLSSCCEYKHRKGARLGGKNGYFGFVNIEGASPCYRCIIAMGLDKKPSPPPKKAKDEDYDSNEEKENVRECESIMDKETIDDMERDEECEEDDNTREKEIEDTSSVYDKTDMEDEEEQDKEYEGGKKEDQNDEYEADDEAKDEYDEDFEVEEEKPDEKTNEEGQVDDQVNGKSKSPSDDEKDDLDHEGESNKPSKEATETSDSEKDERDGHSDSEYEEDKQERKHSTGSVSSHSTIYTSSSEDGSGDEEGEAKTSSSEHPKKRNKKTLQNSENIQDSVTHLGEDTHSEEQANEEPKLEETGETEDIETCPSSKEDNPLPEDTVAEPQPHPSEDDNERCVSPSENGCEQEVEYEATVHMDESSSKTQDNLINDNTHSETEEEGDGRSVQEKIAEAIDHEEHFNSEPEPSDSSTDEEDNFKNAFHGSKSSLEQTSLNETEELIEQNNTERSTSRADSMTLEAASESVNLQTVNEESLTRSATFNDLENGSQNIDEHIQDEEATAGEELKQAEDAVEESKQPDELIDNGESTNDTISVEVATDCEKKELESLHEELTNNENDIEAQLETPEIEGDIEIQNNSDVCAPDAGEIKEEKLDDQNAEEQNIPLEESGDATGNEVKDEEAVENGDITINEDHDLSAETSTTLNMENEDAGFSNDTKGEEEEDHIEEHERTGTLTTEEENIAVTSDSVDEVEETENQLVQEEEQHASENEIAEDSAKNDDLSEGNVDKEQTEDGIQAIDDTAIELSDNNENVTKEEQNENNDNEYADTSHDEVVACTNTENLTSSVTEEGEAVVLLEPSDSVKTENEVHSEFTGAENASRAVSPETNDSTKCIAIDANSNEEQTAEDNGLPNDQGEAKENEESTNGEEVHQAEISDTGNEMENVASSVMVEDEDKEQTEDGIQEIADTATELPDTSEDVTEEEQNENNDNEGTDTSHDAGNEVDSCTDMENLTSSVMVEDEDKEQTEDSIQEIAENATELPDTSEDITKEEQNENNDNEGTDTSHDVGNEVDSCTDMENLTSSVTVEDEDKEQTEDSIQEIAETATELPDTSEDITEEEQNENNDNEGTGTSHDAGNEGDSCTDMENVTSSIMVEEEDKEQAEDDIQEIADTSADLPETNEDITEQEQSENNDEGADTSNDADNELDPCNDMENVPNSVTEEEEPELVEPSDILTTENEDISAENASIAVSPDTHDSNECIVIEDDNSKEEHTTEESSENNALSSHQDDGNQDVSDLSRDDANLEEEQTTEESSENNGLPSDPDDGNQDINGDTENLINEKEVESVNEEMQLQSQDVAVKDDMANVMEAFSDETEKAIECDNNDVEHTDPSTEEHSANDSSKEMASAPEDSGLETQDESSDVNAVSGDMTSKTEDEPDNVAENNLLDDEEGTDNKDNSSNADQLGQEESLTSDVNENEHNQDDIVNESASENNEEDTPAEMCSSEQDSVNNIASLDQDNENTIEQSTETKEESSSVNEEAAETGDVVSTDINNVAGAEKLEEEIDAESTIENVSINNLHETDANSNEENGETEENADSKEEDVSQIVDEEEIKNTGALEPETSQSERADNDKPEIEQEATPVTEFSESSENIEESKEEEGEVNETDQDISPNDAENTLPNDKTEEILNVSELGTVNSIPDNEISQTENEDPI